MKLPSKKIILIATVIFVMALSLRTYDLGGSDLGSDEGLWMERGSKMITYLAKGEFKKSVERFERHPGVPAAFLMGLSMKTLGKENIKNDIDSDIVKYNYAIAPPASFSLRILDPLTAARLPIAILGALTCVFLFIFLNSLFSFKIASLAAVILTFSPFHIAASRMAHQDVALGLFIMISLFVYFLGEQKNKNWLKIVAGMFFGLAFLTKVIALLIPLIIFIWKILTYIFKNKKKSFEHENIFTYTDLIVLIIGVGMFFLLYPNMWDNALHSFTIHLLQNFSKEAVKDDHFFKGENTYGKVPLFYAYSLFMRIPILILFAFLIGIVTSVINFLKNKKRALNLFILLCFFLLLFSFMGVSKVQERYLIPIWQFISLFAALGIVFLLKKSNLVKNVHLALVILLIILGGSFVFIKTTPNFYLYYNLLSGDSDKIRATMPVGRGEGLSLAAEYLNKKQKESGRTLNVFSTYSTYFKTYSKSNVIGWNDRKWTKKNIYENIDYYVIYVRDIQHRSPDLLYRKVYLEKEPEKIIRLNNIDTAWIFKNE